MRRTIDAKHHRGKIVRAAGMSGRRSSIFTTPNSRPLGSPSQVESGRLSRHPRRQRTRSSLASLTETRETESQRSGWVGAL